MILSFNIEAVHQKPLLSSKHGGVRIYSLELITKENLECKQKILTLYSIQTK